MQMFTDWLERYKRMPGNLKIGVNVREAAGDLSRFFAIVRLESVELDPDHLPAILLAHSWDRMCVRITSGDIVTIRDMDTNEYIDEIIVSPYYGYNDVFEGFVVRQYNVSPITNIIKRIESDI